MSSKEKKYCNIDVKNLDFVGRGTQGTVYKLSEYKVIKIFKYKNECTDQINTLLKAQNCKFFTKVYEYDEISIVLEFLPGEPLSDYLKKYPITKEISLQLVEIMKAFKYLGFTRVDMRLKHIFIQPNGMLKVIDPRKSYVKNIPYPQSMLRGLKRLKQYDLFFDFIKNYYPEEFLSWQKNN